MTQLGGALRSGVTESVETKTNPFLETSTPDDLIYFLSLLFLAPLPRPAYQEE